MKWIIVFVTGILGGAFLLYGGCKWASVCAIPPKPIKMEHHVELLDVMHNLQRLSDKVYFSGKAKNKTLAGWYMWKLKSQALHVTKHQTIPWYPSQYDEADLFDKMLMPVIDELSEVVEKEQWDEFEEIYSDLTDTCNACHAMTKHEYVRIIVPTRPAFTNQDYNPIVEEEDE